MSGSTQALASRLQTRLSVAGMRYYNTRSHSPCSLHCNTALDELKEACTAHQVTEDQRQFAIDLVKIVLNFLGSLASIITF